MALIKCPGCGKEISQSAAQCVHCGHVFASAQNVPAAQIPQAVVASDRQQENLDGFFARFEAENPNVKAMKSTIDVLDIVGIIPAITFLLGSAILLWAFVADFAFLPSLISTIVLSVGMIIIFVIRIIQMVLNRNITLSLRAWSDASSSNLRDVMTSAFGQDNSAATKSYMKTFKRNLGFVISAEFLKSTGVDHHKERFLPQILSAIFMSPMAFFILLASILEPFVTAKIPESFARSYPTLVIIVFMLWLVIVPSIFSSKKIDEKIDIWMAQNFPNQNMVYLLLYRPVIAKKQQNRR